MIGSLDYCESCALYHVAIEACSTTIHPTEIRTSISPPSAVELNTTSALANYATEAGLMPCHPNSNSKIRHIAGCYVQSFVSVMVSMTFPLRLTACLMNVESAVNPLLPPFLNTFFFTSGRIRDPRQRSGAPIKQTNIEIGRRAASADVSGSTGYSHDSPPLFLQNIIMLLHIFFFSSCALFRAGQINEYSNEERWDTAYD
uniref:Uncharacterized protein n=1 Tax=Timema genevievae TaxID=629358 RepID=A0A7R9JUA9_TIMGE|nr:unnamed protein product [Timema genevievae]